MFFQYVQMKIDVKLWTRLFHIQSYHNNAIISYPKLLWRINNLLRQSLAFPVRYFNALQWDSIVTNHLFSHVRLYYRANFSNVFWTKQKTTQCMFGCATVHNVRPEVNFFLIRKIQNQNHPIWNSTKLKFNLFFPVSITLVCHCDTISSIRV